MIRRLRLYRSADFDPYRNLAVEQHLLETAEEGCCILYLWQNRNTVVIGRNQNAWKECRTTELEKDGGHLARRLSGGGAVFHDLGNLNFTFLVPSADYDLDRQLSVVQEACRALGVEAERSGRNDILSQGRKFSGNAFYHNRGRSYHHGTLLVDVDMAALGRYLRPSEAKLKAKGVDSVRARVVNLRELSPDITVEALRRQLDLAFGRVYGLPVEPIADSELDAAAVDALTRRNGSWEWLYGRSLPCNFSCEDRFAWGELRLELQVESGVVRHAAVFTDAMDWSLADKLQSALTGCRFRLAELCQRAAACGLDEGQDVADLLKRQDI
ncbi:MAG: lipoate--protein ligase [Oscillospiraceae bacterium]|nr:lipoate--protein ligase [Oscillospiraceae bacterium]